MPDYPFQQCSADSKTIDTTGGTLAAIFTSLTQVRGRSICIQNRGSVDLLLGQDTTNAVFHLLPGAAFTLTPKELASVFIKAASATCVADAFLII